MKSLDSKADLQSHQKPALRLTLLGRFHDPPHRIPQTTF